LGVSTSARCEEWVKLPPSLDVKGSAEEPFRPLRALASRRGMTHLAGIGTTVL